MTYLTILKARLKREHAHRKAWDGRIAKTQAKIAAYHKRHSHRDRLPKNAFGIDWAWGTPDIPALKKAGVRFACRYLSTDASKNLTASQAKALSAAGIPVVVVWETLANRALQGRGAGAADAKAAWEQANQCGQPSTAPIYFAVDFDVTPAQQAAVDDYFRGVNQLLGVHRTGVYAGFWPVKRLLDAKLVGYAWQTYAWSGSNVDKRAHIYQYRNAQHLGGVSCDFNRALKPNIGHWHPSLTFK